MEGERGALMEALSGRRSTCWSLPGRPALARRGAAARHPLRPTSLGTRFRLRRGPAALYSGRFRDYGSDRTVIERRDAVLRRRGALADFAIWNVGARRVRARQEPSLPTRIGRFLLAICKVEEGRGGTKPEPLPPFPSPPMKPEAQFSHRIFRPASAQS